MAFLCSSAASAAASSAVMDGKKRRKQRCSGCGVLGHRLPKCPGAVEPPASPLPGLNEINEWLGSLDAEEAREEWLESIGPEEARAVDDDLANLEVIDQEPASQELG